MLLLNLINIIFKEGKVPDMLKEGLLTPVFKNKGEKNMATNYRGITVLPVLNKVIETIVKLRINPAVLITQNVTQRGFTAGSTGKCSITSRRNIPKIIHPILRIKHQSPRDSKRVPTKIKLLTGTYILQPLRYKIYKEGTEDHCIACECKEETLEHLLIECEAWNCSARSNITNTKYLLTTNGNVRVEDLTCEMTIQVLMDITKIQKIYRITSDLISQIEFQSRRLVFLIHNARYQLVMKDQAKKKAA
ncbi:unnamed protein product [Mytilus edulis]|uniref:Reverse transcriptase domain-containing protein n=1 Tax=Mytilus edulis TaxID=6550 RepID=A0A8S3UR98_MYTED|nr:unnamed protein product [Mytilus edulis]